MALFPRRKAADDSSPETPQRKKLREALRKKQDTSEAFAAHKRAVAIDPQTQRLKNSRRIIGQARVSPTRAPESRQRLSPLPLMYDHVESQDEEGPPVNYSYVESSVKDLSRFPPIKTKIAGKSLKKRQDENKAQARHRYYEESTGYGIPKKSYKKLVKAYMQNFEQDEQDEREKVYRLQGAAGEMLQIDGESFVDGLVRAAYVVSRIRKASTLRKNDFRVAKAIRRDNLHKKNDF